MEKFEIRTDIILNHYSDSIYPMDLRNPELKRTLIEFLFQKGHDTSIDNLYADFIDRSSISHKLLGEFPHQEPYNKNKIPSARQMKIMASHMLQNLDIDHSSNGPFNWYVYGFVSEINPKQLPSWGVILNQRVDVDAKTDRSFFKYFFCHILSRVDNPENFLEYHLAKTFDNNEKRYRLFLMDCMDGVTARKNFLTEWLALAKSDKQLSKPDPEELTKYVFKELRFTVNGTFAHNVKVAQIVGAYEALKPYLPAMSEGKAANYLQAVVGLPDSITRIKKSNYEDNNPHFKTAFDNALDIIEKHLG